MGQMVSRQTKLNRIRGGTHPTVIDLFAGSGGLSLGFSAAGFQLLGAIEIDKIAADSHARNLFMGARETALNRHRIARDIGEFEPEEWLSTLHDGPNPNVDVIIGGPPCQAYARVGRAKLREVAEHPDAFRQDPRSNLYLRYLHFVEKLQPLAILMENVPDVLNFGGHNINEEICEVLEGWGYKCSYSLLNSAFYGVPQMRERAFLIALAEEVGSEPSFPECTNYVTLPKGYLGSRNVALKTLQPGLFREQGHYVDPPQASTKLPPAVTAEGALRDLPRITIHLEGKLKRGARRFTELVEYRKDLEPSGFGRLMRRWPGFESPEGVWDHVIRYLPRDYDIFRGMKAGDQYPEAVKYAHQLFRKRLAQLSTIPQEGSPEYEELKSKTIPPYDPRKFPNKWRKMEPDAPARTLMAHLGKDSYSHIHYDSSQARTISVREAARLQSFPDGFVFSGTMNPAFRQIGNAVPPVLAHRLALKLADSIGWVGAKHLPIEDSYALGPSNGQTPTLRAVSSKLPDKQSGGSVVERLQGIAVDELQTDLYISQVAAEAVGEIERLEKENQKLMARNVRYFGEACEPVGDATTGGTK